MTVPKRLAYLTMTIKNFEQALGPFLSNDLSLITLRINPRKGTTTLSITTLSIMTLSINDTQQK
jgi:hypothetical protein